MYSTLSVVQFQWIARHQGGQQEVSAHSVASKVCGWAGASLTFRVTADKQSLSIMLLMIQSLQSPSWPPALGLLHHPGPPPRPRQTLQDGVVEG
ncbi:hypothetical protein F751_4967 [Auxenochlorella protothecoides]|uniref:Uncharacterized protein n=1 Tax=Auxenochlorella protothecoides TaxID=3075 RepID=A0A087SMF2_AUXPR|nr:hypothetical protein F751_4967 [Auxenochlorella protothecoides]KFM26906.1 hypothetical protein F751_4967 [Auxenochlorella protothecoides]